MEKRLRVLEDVEAIKDMHREYVFSLINHQWEALVDYFADDATVVIASNNPCKGKKEIASLLIDRIAKRVTWDEGHLLAQPVIQVDGDTAKGHWIMFVFLKEGWRQCRYDCEYVKIDGKWKFSSLIYKAPWPVPPEK